MTNHRNVRICDLNKSDFNQQFIKSVINTGFAVITNHGIDHGLIKEIQMQWRLFFLSNQENKENFINVENPNLGYHGYKKEQAVGAVVPDLKEFFHWMPNSKIPDGLSGITQSLYSQLENIGLSLLYTLSQYQNTRRYDLDCKNSDKTLLRTLYYQATDYSKEPGAVRAAAHEDINHITLLVAASASGLEVKDNDDNWYAAPHEENSITVNVGDMLQLASEGFYKSTTHRVVNADDSNSDRLSIPLFIHPKTNTVLDKNTGFTAGQYLDKRIKEIYGGRK